MFNTQYNKQNSATATTCWKVISQ